MLYTLEDVNPLNWYTERTLLGLRNIIRVGLAYKGANAEKTRQRFSQIARKLTDRFLFIEYDAGEYPEYNEMFKLPDFDSRSVVFVQTFNYLKAQFETQMYPIELKNYNEFFQYMHQIEWIQQQIEEKAQKMNIINFNYEFEEID